MFTGNYKGILQGNTGEKFTGNIRPRIVTKKLQILDKWELQGNKRGKWEQGHVYGRGGYA